LIFNGDDGTYRHDREALLDPRFYSKVS